jgi:hypothetical protein
VPDAIDHFKVVNKIRRNSTAALEDEIIEAVINLLERSDGIDVAAHFPTFASALFPILASAAAQ